MTLEKHVKHWPIYSVNCGGTTHWWSVPYMLTYSAMVLVILNVIAWSSIGLYEAVLFVA